MTCSTPAACTTPPSALPVDSSAACTSSTAPTSPRTIVTAAVSAPLASQAGAAELATLLSSRHRRVALLCTAQRAKQQPEAAQTACDEPAASSQGRCHICTHWKKGLATVLLKLKAHFFWQNWIST